MNEQIVERLYDRAKKASDRFEAELASSIRFAVPLAVVVVVAWVLGMSSLWLMAFGGIAVTTVRVVGSLLSVLPECFAAGYAEKELKRINGGKE